MQDILGYFDDLETARRYVADRKLYFKERISIYDKNEYENLLLNMFSGLTVEHLQPHERELILKYGGEDGKKMLGEVQCGLNIAK